MDAYTSLVDRVLKIKTLAEQVDSLALENDALNLVTLDWKLHLENNALYQKFQTDAKALYGPNKVSSNHVFRSQNLNENSTMSIITVGQCSVCQQYDKRKKQDSFSITVRDSPMLNMLSKAMNSDVDPENIDLADASRINFKSCSMCCQFCSEAINSMTSKGIKLSFDYVQPCILDLSIYDGRNVMNRFASQISNMFGGTFIAILKFEINKRLFYSQMESNTASKKEWVRLCGDAMKMIAFPASNLQESKMCLGDLTIMTLLGNETKTLEPEASRSNKRSVIDSDDEDEIIDIFYNKIAKKDVEEEETHIEEEIIKFD